MIFNPLYWFVRKFIKHYQFSPRKLNPFLLLFGFRKRELFWFEDGINKVALLKNINVVSHSPLANKNSTELQLQKKMSIYLSEFDYVMVNTCASVFDAYKIKRTYIEKFKNVDTNILRLSEGFIATHDDMFAIIYRKNRIVRFEQPVLFLGGFGAFNFYHFLIEIASKLTFLSSELISELEIKKIVVDFTVKKYPSFEYILNKILDEKNIKLELVAVKHKNEIFAKKLYYINPANNVVMNTRDNSSSFDYSYYDRDSLFALRNLLLTNDLKQVYPNKIYLARKTSTAREYNQSETIDLFEKLGFTVIYPEKYSFQEQIAIFNHASYIVGPSGAAWANLIFCKAGTKALSWLPLAHQEFSTYSTLAKIFSVKMLFEFYETDNSLVHTDYVLNLINLEQKYYELSDM